MPSVVELLHAQTIHKRNLHSDTSSASTLLRGALLLIERERHQRSCQPATAWLQVKLHVKLGAMACHRTLIIPHCDRFTSRRSNMSRLMHVVGERM